MSKLLLIDDDKEVIKINAKYFRQLQYEVEYATNAKSALKKLESFTPDCIIMDVMMPGMDGFKACTKIKEICNAPIIFLTGRDSEDDKIHGLLLGADDYMVKPYSLRELEVRIQVLIRRYQSAGSSAASLSGGLDFSLLHIDKERHKAYYKKRNSDESFSREEIQLTNKEYDMLALLASSPGKVFTFEEIGNAAFGNSTVKDIWLPKSIKELGDMIPVFEMMNCKTTIKRYQEEYCLIFETGFEDMYVIIDKKGGYKIMTKGEKME